MTKSYQFPAAFAISRLYGTRQALRRTGGKFVQYRPSDAFAVSFSPKCNLINNSKYCGQRRVQIQKLR
jgi:hypothetical protein